MTIETAFLLLSGLVGTATTYLRLFVANRMDALKRDIGKEFLTKELAQAQEEPLIVRISSLERRITILEGNGNK